MYKGAKGPTANDSVPPGPPTLAEPKGTGGAPSHSSGHTAFLGPPPSPRRLPCGRAPAGGGLARVQSGRRVRGPPVLRPRGQYNPYLGRGGGPNDQRHRRRAPVCLCLGQRQGDSVCVSGAAPGGAVCPCLGQRGGDSEGASRAVRASVRLRRGCVEWWYHGMLPQSGHRGLSIANWCPIVVFGWNQECWGPRLGSRAPCRFEIVGFASFAFNRRHGNEC